MPLSFRTWPLWDFFYPPLCAFCGRHLLDRDLVFCRQCWADAPIADSQIKFHVPAINMLSAGYFLRGDNMVRAAVHTLKYDGFAELATSMARHLIARIPTRFLEHDVVWTAVPLHWSRSMLRGFNQSQLLLEALANLTGHKNCGNLLKRIKNTPTQTARTARDRKANVSGAFRWQPSLTTEGPPRAVLVFDDVITTGATVNECATVLKSAGVEWVGAFAFALTELESN